MFQSTKLDLLKTIEHRASVESCSRKSEGKIARRRGICAVMVDMAMETSEYFMSKLTTKFGDFSSPPFQSQLRQLKKGRRTSKEVPCSQPCNEEKQRTLHSESDSAGAEC